MRWFILGHSATAGYGLNSIEDAWPHVAARLVAAQTGEMAEVVSVRFHPAGARAVPFALDRAANAEPDLVVLSLNAYPCAVPVVAANVRAHLGARGERLYRRAERFIERRTTTAAGKPRRSNWNARRLAHRLLGARPLASVDEVARVYCEVLNGLASLENGQVLIVVEARFTPDLNAQFPVIQATIERLHHQVRPVAEAHRFAWLDAEAALSGPGWQRYWMSDGVHINAAGSQRYGEMVAAAIIEPGRIFPWPVNL